MTGPKEPRDGQFSLPMTCTVCKQQLQERQNVVTALEELEEHLAEAHGIEVDQ